MAEKQKALILKRIRPTILILAGLCAVEREKQARPARSTQVAAVKGV
jgi:hypothetical protein